MITGGEDALYIARRLVVVASEDVGLADNHALPLVPSSHQRTRIVLTLQAMATYQACQVIGLPECRINLAVRTCHFIPVMAWGHDFLSR